MTHGEEPDVRIGILWRGDRTRESPAPRADRQLGSLFDALAHLRVTVVFLPYDDDAVDDVRGEALRCDAVLVWVNPIQDGANRARLDNLLRDAAARGVFVSASPDVILTLGTKEVLFRTRDLGWGSDTALYTSPEEFRERFPSRLREHGALVVKQGRGNGGNGVWKVEFAKTNDDAETDPIVTVQDAQSRDGTLERVTLAEFMDRAETYFAWSGCLVDQEYQNRLVEGMLRCYLTHDEVVGFARQWPRGLLTFNPAEAPTATPPSVMVGPDHPEYQTLRVKVEREWVPQLMALLELERESLPVIWDADFLYGPKDANGADTYVLCEINVSAVWPFPPTASETVARAAVERARAAKSSRA